MTNDDVNRGSPLDGSTPSSLGRLARVLGCTVGDFYSSTPVDVAQLAEVVRLWGQLTSDNDRKEMLRLLRERAKPPQTK